MLRTTLWFAMQFGLVLNFWPKVLFNKEIWWNPTDQAYGEWQQPQVRLPGQQPQPAPDPSTDEDAHLLVEDISLIYGGFGKRKEADGTYGYVPVGAEADLINQVGHCDFIEKDVDGEMVHVDNNPKLRGRFKPGTGAVPLECDSDREIYCGNPSNMVKVKTGEFFFFSAMNVHGGKSYPITQPLKWRPMLHFHISSLHHQHEPEKLFLSISPRTYMPVEFVDMLTHEHFAEIVEEDIWPHLPAILSRGRQAMISGNAQVIDRFKRILVDFFQKCWSGFHDHILGGHPEEDEEECPRLLRILRGGIITICPQAGSHSFLKYILSKNL